MTTKNVQTVPEKPVKPHRCPDCKDTGVIERQVPRRIGVVPGTGEVVYHRTHMVPARFVCGCGQGWAAA